MDESTRVTEEKDWLELFREREALLEGHFLLGIALTARLLGLPLGVRHE